MNAEHHNLVRLHAMAVGIEPVDVKLHGRRGDGR